MGAARKGMTAMLLRHASRLRHPQLFLIILVLLLVNLLVPDPVPLVDELVLGLILILIGARRKKDPPADGRRGRVVDGEIVDRDDRS